MLHFKLYFALAALCVSSSVGKSESDTSPPEVVVLPIPLLQEAATSRANVTVPHETTVTSTEAPTPEITTTEASTSPDTTTTSTTSTTTEKTTTTTSTPKPDPPKPAPVPPKPAPVPPKPAPGPVPPPEQGTWSYSDDKSNVTCIVIQFAGQLNVTYTKVVENVTSLAYVILNVPANASVVAGSCDGTEQLITLSWPVGLSNVSNTVTFTYQRNDTTHMYRLSKLDVQLSPDVFVNASSKSVVELTHGAEWQTPLATSYRCAAPTRFNMSAANDNAGAVAALTLSRLQEEAFRNNNGTSFSAARECGGGDVPDAVPIAVGCALGGLVVVVLVAYLVGRRRSAARGYVSM